MTRQLKQDVDSFYKVLNMGLGFVLLALCSSAMAEEHPKNENLSVSEARLYIEKQEHLQTIPKSVWQQLLSPDVYRILWKKGTERAHSGTLLHEKRKGTYVTAGCKLPVFSSKHKFTSGTGWPSFWEVLDKDNVVLEDDTSWGMRRTEVLSKCGEHLGHVFRDGPQPTGLRYCINSAALVFVPEF